VRPKVSSAHLAATAVSVLVSDPELFRVMARTKLFPAEQPVVFIAVSSVRYSAPDTAVLPTVVETVCAVFNTGSSVDVPVCTLHAVKCPLVVSVVVNAIFKSTFTPKFQSTGSSSSMYATLPRANCNTPLRVCVPWQAGAGALAVPICHPFPAVTLLQPAAMKNSFVGALNVLFGDSAFADNPPGVVTKPRKFPVPFTLRLNPPLLEVFTVACAPCTLMLPVSVIVVAPESWLRMDALNAPILLNWIEPEGDAGFPALPPHPAVGELGAHGRTMVEVYPAIIGPVITSVYVPATAK